MFAQPCRGRAWRVAQSRGDGVGSGSNRRKPSQRSMTPGLTGPKMLRAGLYARVSTNDQQTLPMQSRAIREYAAQRGWTIAVNVREVGSGAAKREAREKLLEAANGRTTISTSS